MAVRVVQQDIQLMDVPFVTALAEHIHSLTFVPTIFHHQNIHLQNLWRFSRQGNRARQGTIVEEILVTFQRHQWILLHVKSAKVLAVGSYGDQGLVGETHLLYHGATGDVK